MKINSVCLCVIIAFLLIGCGGDTHPLVMEDYIILKTNRDCFEREIPPEGIFINQICKDGSPDWKYGTYV